MESKDLKKKFVDRDIEPARRLIGEVLKKARVGRGYTLDGLAVATNISKRTLFNIEHGFRVVKSSTILTIADVLKVDKEIMVARYQKMMDEIEWEGGIDAYPEIKGSRTGHRFVTRTVDPDVDRAIHGESQ